MSVPNPDLPPDDPYWRSLPDNWYGRKVVSYYNSNGTQRCDIAVMVNRHDFWHWKQGLVQFNVNGYTGADQIYVGSVKLFRDGSQSENTTWNTWINIADGAELDRATSWDQDCDNSFSWYGRAYHFNILWHDGSQLGLTTLDSTAFELGC